MLNHGLGIGQPIFNRTALKGNKLLALQICKFNCYILE